jgi:hypothetical protein
VPTIIDEIKTVITNLENPSRKLVIIMIGIIIAIKVTGIILNITKVLFLEKNQILKTDRRLVD